MLPYFCLKFKDQGLRLIMLTFHSKKGNDLFILKYDGAAVPSATPEGLNLCNPRSDRNGSGGRHLGEERRSAEVAARGNLRRSRHLLSPPMPMPCAEAPRQRLEPIYLRARGRGNTF